jgi:hypothetical protein
MLCCECFDNISTPSIVEQIRGYKDIGAVVALSFKEKYKELSESRILVQMLRTSGQCIEGAGPMSVEPAYFQICQCLSPLRPL